MTTNRRADHRRHPHWFVRLLAGLLIVAAAGYTASFPVAAASPPQDAEPTAGTETTVPPDEEQGIIPEPNSGHEPREAGDRGGALQLLVLAGIVGGLALIAVMIRRESRRNLARHPSPHA